MWCQQGEWSWRLLQLHSWLRKAPEKQRTLPLLLCGSPLLQHSHPCPPLRDRTPYPASGCASSLCSGTVSAPCCSRFESLRVSSPHRCWPRLALLVCKVLGLAAPPAHSLPRGVPPSIQSWFLTQTLSLPTSAPSKLDPDLLQGRDQDPIPHEAKRPGTPTRNMVMTIRP